MMLNSYTLFRIVPLVVIFAQVIPACQASVPSSDRPVIFILDTFVGDENHGEDVTRAVRESGDCCDIRMLSLGEKVQRDIYLAILEDVLDFAIKNPRVKIVVNMSFGSYLADERERDLIEKMLGQGIVLVAAAGNDRTDRPMYPAGYPGVLAVAAVDGADRKTSYSNYGRHIRIAAEGFLKSRIVAQGLKGTGPGVRQNFTYRIYGGTSFAAPRVSGLLGLIMSRRPELSPSDAVNVLLRTAVPLSNDAFFKAQLMGAGRIDPYSALYRVDPVFRRMVIALDVCRLIYLAIWLMVSILAWKRNDLFGPFVQGLLIGVFIWGFEYYALWIGGEIVGRQIGLIIWVATGLAGLVVCLNRRRERRFVEEYRFDPAVFEELGTLNPATGRMMLQRPWLLDHLTFIDKIRPDLAERILQKNFGDAYHIGIKISDTGS